MKNITILTTTLILSLLFSSCSVIGDIFSAGMSFGIFITVFVIGIIIYALVRMMKKNN